jgi:tetratricopeptide (TPR) repeat protein
LSRIQELKRNLSLALQESSWDDALAVLEKLVSVEESQPAYHNQMGDILLKSGRQAEAITSFMRGIHAYRELGMYGNGAALCKKVLRLEPEQREVVDGMAEVRNTFRVPRVGVIAGCYVTSGSIARAAKVRVIRDQVVVYDGAIGSLRRFKDDVKEVATGFECGIGIANFDDVKLGDVLEVYRIEKITRTL